AGSRSAPLAYLPAIATAFLAPAACPCCWATWGGIVCVSGLGTLGQGKYVLPLTIVCMAVALGVMAYQAKKRRNTWPLLLAGIGAALVITGKVFAMLMPATITGAVLLLVASVWSAWPRANNAGVESCSIETTNLAL
ncbi:MAG: hypothetical protein M3R04_06895, partial [bacterium]|nr:hypothetical protein [bacterium]